MIYAIPLILLAFAPAAQPLSSGSPLSCDAALAVVFTPRRPSLGRYEVCTTPTAIEELRGEAGFTYSGLEYLEARDVFGSGGAYDRGKLARLYGGQRARVVRGWRAGGDEFESVTLVTPYPDASLDHLKTGTMVIRYFFTPIAISPVTTSIDRTGSPEPMVASPKRGPN
jgi:hypothetical protein